MAETTGVTEPAAATEQSGVHEDRFGPDTVRKENVLLFAFVDNSPLPKHSRIQALCAETKGMPSEPNV